MSERRKRRAPKSRTPWIGVTLVVFGSVLSLVSGGAFVYTNSLFNTVEDSVPTQDLLGDGDGSAEGGDIEGPVTMLMMGNDHREDNDDGDEIGRTDTIMIMHINENLDNASVLSIPRDLLVTIPDCGHGTPCESKINDAYPLAGENAEPGTEKDSAVQNLAQTLLDLTGLESFDGAGMINFEGFMDLVKTFGSIELCLPFEMEVRHTKNDNYPEGPNGGRILPEGCNDYTHGVALGIVRERYAYGPHTEGWTEEWGMSDFGRQQMQQHFIKQLLKTAKDEGYMSDPTKVGPLVEEVGGQVLLDLQGHSVIDFAFAMRNVDVGSLETLRVPSEPVELDGTSYVQIQEGEQQTLADSLFTALREDNLDEWAAENPEWTNSDA